MKIDKEQVLQDLRLTGRVSLPGADRGWGRRARYLGIIYLAVMAAILIGWPAWGPLRTGGLGGRDMILEVGKIVLILVLICGALWQQRRYLRYGRAAREPVILEPEGLTLRGIGPMPWENFAGAERRRILVRGEDGQVSRELIDLTVAGKRSLDGRLGSRQRFLLNPDSLGDGIDHIHLPTVKGLKPEETREIFNAARVRFAPHRREGD